MPLDPRTTAVARWTLKANAVIDARLADARGHAWNALTQRVTEAQEGRKTLRTAIATKGYKAASARLAELAEALCGPTEASLAGLIRDAREAFYRQSFDLWLPSIPAEIRSKMDAPSASGARVARGLVVHGYSLYASTDAAIDTAKRTLTAAIVMAGAKSATERSAQTTLDTWEALQSSRLRKWAAATISDSEVAVFEMVGRSMVDPRFHAEST